LLFARAELCMQVKSAKWEGLEEFDGHRCHRITGLTRGSAATLLIDAESFMIRQMVLASYDEVEHGTLRNLQPQHRP